MFLPNSTYRVQLQKEFNFQDLKHILDYLQQLGVHTIYASPILQAEPGSMHGYDVTDPQHINPEIGTLDELRDLASELKRRNMKWIQDIVPNHMAFTVNNSRLMDVLERGKDSEYYRYFDINWNHPDPELTGRLMVPFLGKELDHCIADNEIKVEMNNDGLVIKYFETAYPVSPASYELILNLVPAGRGESEWKFMSLNPSNYSALEWRAHLNSLLKSLSSEQRESIAMATQEINKDFELLKSFLELQWYRLVYWKRTEQIINYRRFFTVNSLICLRMEDEFVFDDYHRFIVSLYEAGLIQGVRIDHIDGLNDPSGYLRKLRKTLGTECYIIAEKILESKEEMPEHWPLEGTSGYEFLSYVNQLFTNRAGSERLASFYHSMLPGMPSYEEVVLLNKRLILNGHMAGELENLVTYFFELIPESEIPRDRFRHALSLFMLSLPVYRIYPDKLPLTGRSLELIEEALSMAKQLDSTYERELGYLHSLCLAQTEDLEKKDIIRFLRRLMQFTGPLTAKGVEDTTFYIYNPLISHVEVGDAPSTLGISIQEFHKRMMRRQQVTPYSLNATATHDTKRGEDARIRLNVLSEMPERWIEAVQKWMAMNHQFKRKFVEYHSPVINDEYFIYQSILGGFPEDRIVSDEWIDRLKEYMVKVVREAKVMSNWSEPDVEYEAGCASFIESILATESEFLKTFRPFLDEVLEVAEDYSIAQAVVKSTAPGVPDIYQGCELFDLSYVDPDNRRPVDYQRRQTLLCTMDEIDGSDYGAIVEFLGKSSIEGARKMFAIRKCLALRNRNPELFLSGAYLPLTFNSYGDVVMGYARCLGNDWCLVIVPLAAGRKKNRATEEFSNIFISLPANSPRNWVNIFTGEPIVTTQTNILVGELLNAFPIAVLYGVSAGQETA